MQKRLLSFVREQPFSPSLQSFAPSETAWRTKLIGGTKRGSFILNTVCGVRGS